jgi:hypothetical protein
MKLVGFPAGGQSPQELQWASVDQACLAMFVR